MLETFQKVSTSLFLIYHLLICRQRVEKGVFIVLKVAAVVVYTVRDDKVRGLEDGVVACDLLEDARRNLDRGTFIFYNADWSQSVVKDDCVAAACHTIE